MRIAFSSIASNTGSNSPGDELIARRTSEVRLLIERLAQFAEQPRLVSISSEFDLFLHFADLRANVAQRGDDHTANSQCNYCQYYLFYRHLMMLGE